MARQRAKTTDAPDKGKDAAQAIVHPEDMPKLTVEILDGVEGFIEGQPVKPGDQVDLDFGTATNLVAIKHAKVVGSA